jgi:hypothetical protein
MDLLGPCTNVFLTAYAHVRTEPQSDIGQTRGKKNIFLLLDAIFLLSACSSEILNHYLIESPLATNLAKKIFLIFQWLPPASPWGCH